MQSIAVRLLGAALAIGLACAPAIAAPDDDALKHCAAIDDALERLACYDRASGRTPAPPEPSAGATGASPPPAPNTVIESNQTREGEPLAAALQEGAAGAHLSYMSRQFELDPEAKQGTFLLRPHKQNYFLPARWSNNPNEQPHSPTQPAPPPSDLNNVEAKFQISLKTKVAEDLFGGHSDLWLGYTQQSSWQVYNGALSRPFRETDYEPEMMLVIPFNADMLGLKARFLNLGLVHQSNGRADPLSRSWNRAYAQIGIEEGKFALLARAWYRFPESADNDNNPDIEHYLGYGDIVAVYKWNARNTVSLHIRDNLSTQDNKGAVQLDWSFPLYGRLKGYLQIFSGYGESLIDYNWRQTTIGIGVLLTDWM
jgi:phospholipase A1